MQKPRENESKFLKITCPRCSHKQIVFGKSSLKTKCEKCNRLLIKTSGGKSQVKAKVEKVL